MFLSFSRLRNLTKPNKLSVRKAALFSQKKILNITTIWRNYWINSSDCDLKHIQTCLTNFRVIQNSVKMILLFFVFQFSSAGLTFKEQSENLIQIKVTRDVEIKYETFWDSTGFCPPFPHNKSTEWFLSNDMEQNLAIISSIPYSG